MYRIAVSGKGGTGKTTISGLIVKSLLDGGIKPILAVDADPAGCLAPVLGAKPEVTLGDIREMTRDSKDLPKSQFVEMSVQQAVWEGEGFDLISMGRPEGPGCYCFVNSLLRDSLERLSNSYQAMVIDCEAGMEHLSRRTAGRVDLLVLVSDLSARGIRAAKEMINIARKLDNVPRETRFILNCTREGEPPELLANKINEAGFSDYLTAVYDPGIVNMELRGESFLKIGEDSPVLMVVREMLDDYFGEGE
ncbi:MAG: AAA family ATPase [candidate division Zixibacteria bacterium]|nr:AAA family ATPase [Candidatus Tariuqbacter arcticus]